MTARTKLRPLPILAGLAVDVAASVCVGVALSLLTFALSFSSGDQALAAATMLRQATWMRILGLFGTTAATALGGLVAALLGKPHGRAHAFVMGLASTVLGLTLVLALPGIAPTWKVVTGLLATLPAAMFGGRMARRFFPD